MVTVNKYRVKMYEKDGNLKRSMNGVMATSDEEAIEKVRHDDWWYYEGEGHNYNAIKYPVTFEAKVQQS